MVDWSLAAQVARFAAGSDPPTDLQVDLPALVAETEPEVAAHTRLELADPVPPPELVGRRDWAEANLRTLADLLDPVAARLDRRLDSAGPLAGALRMGAGATLAAEAGLVTGYLSQRVLGQYELSLIQLAAPPRLLFVAPNLDQAVRDARRRPRLLLRLDRDPRAHARLPVPGCAVAPRAPRRPRARVPLVGRGSDRARRGGRAAGAAEPSQDRRAVPRGRSGGARADARAARAARSHAGPDGGRRGLLRARDGRAGRAPRCPNTTGCALP